MSCSFWTWTEGRSPLSLFTTMVVALTVCAFAAGAIPASATATPTAASAASVKTRHPNQNNRILERSAHVPVVSRALKRVTATRVALFPGTGYRAARGSVAVRALQWWLAHRGDSPGPLDGRYGPLTERAVRRFQLAHGLVPDGIAGPRTVAALVSRTPILYPGAGYASPRGASSVRVLQRRLSALGFAPGPVDGRYGPRTMAAVERFQHARRLQVDGVVGRQTGTALWAAPPAHRRPELRPARTPHRVPAPEPTAHRRSTRRPATQPPTLPLTLVLIALGILGLGTAMVSYRRTKAKVSRGAGSGPQANPEAER